MIDYDVYSLVEILVITLLCVDQILVIVECRVIAVSSLTQPFFENDLQPKMMDFEEAPLSSTPTKVAPFMPERLKAIQMPKPFHI